MRKEDDLISKEAKEHMNKDGFVKGSKMIQLVMLKLGATSCVSPYKVRYCPV